MTNPLKQIEDALESIINNPFLMGLGRDNCNRELYKEALSTLRALMETHVLQPIESTDIILKSMTAENKMPELKPCPFCGVTPTIEQIETTSMYSVVCGHGGTCEGSGLLIAMVDRGKGIGAAIAVWNARADIAQKNMDILGEKQIGRAHV